MWMIAGIFMIAQKDDRAIRLLGERLWFDDNTDDNAWIAKNGWRSPSNLALFQSATDRGCHCFRKFCEIDPWRQGLGIQVSL